MHQAIEQHAIGAACVVDYAAVADIPEVFEPLEACAAIAGQDGQPVPRSMALSFVLVSAAAMASLNCQFAT